MNKVNFIVILALAVFTFSFFLERAGAQGTGLHIGDQAPEFRAPTDEDEIWDSRDYVGKTILVVFFYPAAMTGGCTIQACNFRDSLPRIEEAGATVIGISGDQAGNLKLFRRLHNLNFPLLSDADGQVASAFGVPTRGGRSITRQIDGREYVLSRDITTARWTFIIDMKGEVVYIDREVQAAGDSEKVMNAIREMNRSSDEKLGIPHPKKVNE